MNRERAHLRRADAQRADSQGSKAVALSPTGRWRRAGVHRALAYRLALFLPAQYAFSRFDMAFFAAALIGFRVRFWVVVV